jgi:hypothetical protein
MKKKNKMKKEDRAELLRQDSLQYDAVREQLYGDLSQALLENKRLTFFKRFKTHFIYNLLIVVLLVSFTVVSKLKNDHEQSVAEHMRQIADNKAKIGNEKMLEKLVKKCKSNTKCSLNNIWTHFNLNCSSLIDHDLVNTCNSKSDSIFF